MNIRRGLARIAHDQVEHITTLAILVQNGLERRRITRLVTFGIKFVSFLPVIGFDFSLSLLNCEAESSQVKLLISIIHFTFFNEQQHSQIQEFFVIMV
jgi:hypothetical protein